MARKATPPLDLFKEALAAKSCPPSGTGCHSWLYWAACCAADGGLTEEEVVPLIEEAMSRAPSPATEIEDALRAARREEREPTNQWPGRDLQKVQIILAGPEQAVEPVDAATEQVLPLLFPGDPLVCIGKSSSDFNTRRISEFKFVNANSLIVPSPMSALKGKTKAGHMSAHALANTGPRHFMVVEFDWGLIQGQYKLLNELSAHGDLVMIVHSGSKSAHGWFDVRGKTEAEVFKFFTYAVSLGADPRLWLRSQFCRLPAGTRDNGKVQNIMYLDDDYLRETQEKSKAIPSDWDPGLTTNE